MLPCALWDAQWCPWSSLILQTRPPKTLPYSPPHKMSPVVLSQCRKGAEDYIIQYYIYDNHSRFTNRSGLKLLIRHTFWKIYSNTLSNLQSPVLLQQKSLNCLVKSWTQGGYWGWKVTCRIRYERFCFFKQETDFVLVISRSHPFSQHRD